MKLPPIYAINLDRDVKRWKKLEQIVQSAGISNIQRFSAIDGRNMDADKFKESTTWVGRQLQPVGVLGCALSHIALWKKIIEDDTPAAIILEDDVELVANFREKLEYNLQQLFQTYPTLQLLPSNIPPPHSAAAAAAAGGGGMVAVERVSTHPTHTAPDETFDVILLGGLGRVHPEGRDTIASRLFSRFMGGRQTLLKKSATLYRPVRPAGTHAYLVTRRGAQKLLKACPKARFHIDIDAWGRESVDVLMFNPMLAYQSFDTSTLIDHSPHHHHRDCHSSLVRQLLRAEVSELLPATLVDPFTRQPWKHALAEPLLQLPAVWRWGGGGGRGLVLRTDQYLTVCSVGGLLALASHLLRRDWLKTVLLRGTLGFAVLIRALIALLLHSAR